MKIRVINCSDPSIWYSNCVGEEFKVIYYDKKTREYVVVATDGYTNIVKSKDAQESGHA